jgi:hypothetical protein
LQTLESQTCVEEQSASAVQDPPATVLQMFESHVRPEAQLAEVVQLCPLVAVPVLVLVEVEDEVLRRRK